MRRARTERAQSQWIEWNIQGNQPIFRNSQREGTVQARSCKYSCREEQERSPTRRILRGDIPHKIAREVDPDSQPLEIPSAVMAFQAAHQLLLCIAGGTLAGMADE